MIKSELIQKIADDNPHLYHRDVERIVAGERDVDGVAFSPQSLRDSLGEFLFVVDYQDAHGPHGSLASGAAGACDECLIIIYFW